MIDFGGDAPGAYLPVAVVQLHFTSPQSQLLFDSHSRSERAHALESLSLISR
ncbi:hypothetical protein ACMC8D_001561 [Escherichia coli]|uniref:hypothetical protein n=1 Tax=Enterobacteriaceae TaxID=543 RepID=UPI00039DC272|nr:MULTISPECIES: hypothetical protein [Enterobacteriaceae]DAI79622.1 MAG TPA: hypothetical protein [Bacteriophage sp.]EEZ4318711.1 hypothetical protein [Escherichia coli]EIX4328678.1 hypothetical protein [Escherichia coli]EJD4143111.1 hypothetical protein [Escherichia coli]ELH6604880.1 hypothetical protein [Escherichia coli]